MLVRLTANGWTLVGFDSPTKARLHKGDFVGYVVLSPLGATFRYFARQGSAKPFKAGRDYSFREVEELLARRANNRGHHRGETRHRPGPRPADGGRTAGSAAAGAAPPGLLPIRPEGIPAMLRGIDQWLLAYPAWNGKKYDKPPRNIFGEIVNEDDPAHWSSFGRVQAVAARRMRERQPVGLGLAFRPWMRVVAVDLDGCVDPATGEIEPWAREWLRRCGSYAEYSISGTGIHIFVVGTLPNGDAGKRAGRIELYCDKRFLLITGHRIDGTPASIEANQEAIDALYAHVVAKQKRGGRADPGERAEPARLSPPLSDVEVLVRASRAANRAKFSELFDDGDIAAYGGDDSAADAALASMLGFYSQDPAQIERIMRLSALARSKWDEHSTYLSRTIDFALDREEVYLGYAGAAEAQDGE